MNVRVAIACAGLAAIGAGGQQPPPTKRLPAASPHATRGVTYHDDTARAGLSRFTHVSGTPEKNYIIEATGSGVALWDFDNDGLLDVYLVNGSTIDRTLATMVRSGSARTPHAAAQAKAARRAGTRGGALSQQRRWHLCRCHGRPWCHKPTMGSGRLRWRLRQRRLRRFVRHQLWQEPPLSQ